MKIESLVKYKIKLKRSTPRFIKQNARNIKRLDLNWRKPRGSQSKMRLRKGGKPKMVSIGYKTPKALQGVLNSGLRERLVSNIDELKSLNTKTECAVLNSTLGKRKTLIIIQEAKKLGISFNYIQVENKVKDIQDFLANRKKDKDDRAKKKKEKKKASKKDEKQEPKEKKEMKKDVEDLKKAVEEKMEKEKTKVDEELKSKEPSKKETKDVKKKTREVKK